MCQRPEVNSVCLQCTLKPLADVRVPPSNSFSNDFRMSAVPSIAVKCVRFNVTRGVHVNGAGSSIFLETWAPSSTTGGLGGCASATPGIIAISVTATLRKLFMPHSRIQVRRFLSERWIVLLIAGLAVLAQIGLYGSGRPEGPVRSDGISYHVYLPAIVLYGNPTLWAV